MLGEAPGAGATKRGATRPRAGPVDNTSAGGATALGAPGGGALLRFTGVGGSSGGVTESSGTARARASSSDCGMSS
mgnify:CR=1 FL=1